MRPIVYCLLLIVYCLLGGACVSSPRQLPLQTVEIADTDQARAIGLMHRHSLCPECAMLFVFQRQRPCQFWMKNTFISLDMIFCAADGTVVAIHSHTEPNQTDILYPSVYPVQYVLEVNAGYTETHHIKIGDHLDIQTMLRQH